MYAASSCLIHNSVKSSFATDCVRLMERAQNVAENGACSKCCRERCESCWLAQIGFFICIDGNNDPNSAENESRVDVYWIQTTLNPDTRQSKKRRKFRRRFGGLEGGRCLPFLTKDVRLLRHHCSRCLFHCQGCLRRWLHGEQKIHS